jgi:hypothetical protein
VLTCWSTNDFSVSGKEMFIVLMRARIPLLAKIGKIAALADLPGSHRNFHDPKLAGPEQRALADTEDHALRP